MKRVLIADDSDFMLDRLEQTLSGVKDVELVAVCRNGTDALTAMRNLKPDVASLDNKMPGLKGVEVIRKIRKVDKEMKLILLTFYADAHYRELAMKAGADCFLSKSEDFEKIQEVIKQWINK